MIGKRARRVLMLVAFGAAAAVTARARRVAADAPAGRYAITNGGTSTGMVYDTQTGLTWQQAVPGSVYPQPSAASYCSNGTGLPGNGWRLPSLTELQSIVDDSRSYPAIDPTAFPSTPVNRYWTSSPYAPSPGDAWSVSFDDGHLAVDIVIGDELAVRCVR